MCYDCCQNCSPAQPTKSLGARLREMTFLNFASIEYDGNVYMTPADFLQSIVDDKPRRKIDTTFCSVLSLSVAALFVVSACSFKLVLMDTEHSIAVYCVNL